MTHRRTIYAAIAFSVAVHAALVPPSVHHFTRAKEADSEPMPTTVTVPLAEWLGVESLPPEPEEPDQETPEETALEELDYVRTSRNQESSVPPETPNSESDKNTLAASSEPSADEGPEGVPTIREGTLYETRDVVEREFRDGEFLEESPTENVPPAVPTPPVPQTETQQATAPRPASESEEMVAPLPPDETAIPLPSDLPSEEPEDGQAEEKVDAEEAEELLEEQTASEFIENPLPPSPQPLTPAPSELDLPNLQNEAYQPQTRPQILEGRTDRVGDDAFDTKDTPLGRYKKKVWDAIDRRWRQKIMMNRDITTYSHVRIRFTVALDGTVGDTVVVEDDSNALLTDITLGAIMEAEVPAMPPEVRSLMDGGKLPMDCTFHID